MSVCCDGASHSHSTRRERGREVLAGWGGRAWGLRGWRFWPLLLLLLALSTVFFFSNDRGYFYRGGISENHMALAANISYSHNFLGFYRETLNYDGSHHYIVYNRFPIGGFLLIKLFILPFSDDLSAQIYAAQVLMLLFFVGTAVLAFLAIARISSNFWISLTVTALAFSSYYWLYFNDMIATEMVPDLLGMMLVFHGMAIFAQDGRFRQLLIKACIALLLGWHVYAIILPFVILGLVKEAVRVRSGSIYPLHRDWLWRQWMLGRLGAAAALRSRYLVLGVVALLFGMAVLGFNFVNEYLALKGEVGFTELPSYLSMVGRTGLDGSYSSEYPEYLDWLSFLEGQFYRIGGMSIPYSLPGYANALGQYPDSPLGLQGVITGMVVSGVGLAGLVLVRHKLLLATLALSGFVWAVPMRGNTAFPWHDYESLAYTGIPLVFFLLVLLGISKLSSDRLVAGLAVIALLIFVMSSFQMARVGNDAETSELLREMTNDFEVIRRITEGNTVMVQGNPFDIPQINYNLRRAIDYHLAGSVIVDREQTRDYADFLLDSKAGIDIRLLKTDTDIGLLTPDNSHAFLYDRAVHDRWVDGVIEEAGDPVIRSVFEVYRHEVGLVYIKDDCRPDEVMDRFLLHIVPVDRGDLPVERSQYAFDNLDFYLEEYAVNSPGRCAAIVPLPDYAIRSIRTGQYFYQGDGPSVRVWDDGFDVLLHTAYRAMEEAGEPVIRSVFEVYRHEGSLVYVQDDCRPEDIEGRFFLHIVPADREDLPVEGGQGAFDNRDFDFGEYAVNSPGRCIAVAALPDYGIRAIRTGQFLRLEDGSAEDVWRGSFDFPAR